MKSEKGKSRGGISMKIVEEALPCLPLLVKRYRECSELS